MRKAIALFATICFTGCAIGGVATGPEKEFQAAAVSVKEKKYQEAAGIYKKIAADDTSATAADALYELALVQAHHDNPGRDYAQAIQTFEQFIKRYPGHEKTDEARSWISALKSVQELKQQIEQLKRIDIRHEERRRK